MLPDIRLDYITKIDQQFLDMMTELRKEYIVMDSKLRVISTLQPGEEREGVARCLSLARTKLEEALHYSIKALCIMGEVKE